MADITFNCPHCEQKIEAPEEMAEAKVELTMSLLPVTA
jgi:hypothetical protein